MKRTTNEANPKRLIFVCSCICKKTTKDDDELSNPDTQTESVRKRSNNLKGFVKRHNMDSCSYRLTFVKQENGDYVLNNKLVNVHNHPPEDAEKVIIYPILNYILLLFFFKILGFLKQVSKYQNPVKLSKLFNYENSQTPECSGIWDNGRGRVKEIYELYI
jgi:hypothetical protein